MTLLKAEWAIPIITVLGLGIAKVWSWFHKSNSNHIDKFTAIGNIENEMRDDLMSRLKTTETRLDILINQTASLNTKVSLQSAEIVSLKQLVIKRERRISALGTAIENLLIYIQEYEPDINSAEIEKIIRIANV